jgi:hypothetical protein
MRTIDFSKVLFDALQYSGNDRHNITSETFAQFRDFGSARLREAWESNQWADICRLSPFTTSFDVNNVAYFNPANEADEILGVYSRNPQETTKAIQVAYQIYDSGSERRVIIGNQMAEGWYMYRLDCPSLDGELYSPTVVYFQGAQVYFDSGSGTGSYTPVLGKPHSGNFYICTATTTTAGQNPNSHPSLWTKIEIPYIFGSFMSWASAANWFVSEGQIQEASVVESKAKEVLDFEYDKFLRQQGQVGKINMTNTY